MRDSLTVPNLYLGWVLVMYLVFDQAAQRIEGGGGIEVNHY